MKGLKIGKSKNGKGIFATKSFNENETLFEIKGVLISGDEDVELDEVTRSNTIRFNEEWYLSPKGEFGNYINHSCEPNTKVIKKNKKIFVVSIRDIEKGEELSFDYSTVLAPDDSWEMKCNRGSVKCRKVIKKFKTLPKKLREKYISLGMVPDYILEIDAI